MSKRVTEIWIYPVKSLGGIRLASAKVLPKGLKHDRRWMLIDNENKFMTQRVYPEMALFKLSFVSGSFMIRYKDQSIDLPFSHDKEPISAVVWDDTVKVLELSKEHSDWFSATLGIKCRLVSFPEDKPRPVDPLYSVSNDHVSLADAYPLLIIGEQSLNDLNQRLEESVPMNRFRPNIVFSGGEAYEEDSWKNFRINQNSCVLTTVNQDTGKKGTEPLATLSTYRKQNNKVYFGQNLLAIDYNEIAEGDQIVLE
jgi:uncharacterized protein YcbX